MKKLILIIALSLFCGTLSGYAEKVDYSDPRNWSGGFSSGDKPVDVLFFPPTSVLDSDGEGHNMSIENEKQRKSMDYWFGIAREMFGEDCNLYFPYYRQITMESWNKPHFAEARRIAYGDVCEAFDYYMKHHNSGKPFILAGHSQGAMMLYALLGDRITAENYPRLIVAYAIGYRLSVRDLEQSPYIRPAQNAVDVGVTVSYHTAASSQRAMFPNNPFNINPLNWRTDTATAPAEMNLGSVFFDSDGRIIREIKAAVSARLDPETGALIAEGEILQDLPLTYLGHQFFAKGNYHIWDLSLFFRNLQQNVKDRIASYFYKKQNAEH